MSDSPISRTNYSPNQLLTSTSLNSQLNTVYDRVNDLDGVFIKDNTITKAKLTDGAIPNVNLTTSTSSYTVTESDNVNLANATSGAIVYTLPTAIGNDGLTFYFKKTDSSVNTVTIDGSGVETIDGETTKILYSQYDSLKIVSDGTNWIVLENGIKNRFQTKFLTADVTANGDMADLTFTNLVTGRIYQVLPKFLFLNPSGTTDTYRVEVRSAALGAGSIYTVLSNTVGFGGESNDIGQTIIFEAASSNLYFRAEGIGTGDILGDGTTTESFVTLIDVTEKYIETTELD